MSTKESHTWNRPSVFQSRVRKWAVYSGIVLFVLWSVWELRVPIDRLIVGFGAGADMVSSMFPPDFGPTARGRIWTGMIDTIAMSIVATIAGVILSAPVAFMAAKNYAPRPVYYIGMGIIVFSRTFHPLILAIVFVKAVGVGPLAGVITLAVVTIGFFAKLLSEEIEDMDRLQYDAIRATGANPFQSLAYGIIPQIKPRFIGLSVYRWDINFRASTIIGIVGGGGIGSTLMSSFQRFQLDFSLAILITILICVMIGEVMSLKVREKYQ
ncbi:phosphonate ABC transporter, permease protein PhnE [Natrarchaeobius chitinivorans]|uniref:Phosphonate ABC transporter, permease protein PhnE n=1 Tax=Natrarchaeobius chitinivorans TaxID=1679083 RepID=A0A3N6MDA0_NATCH|nr:phosphonate ABC transporter, permease protein PhnE [Natrarchaeobius chitinivorans]RQG93521.1 phosphonate ABC transporter, permease protein PhnE [Natrarchaeobius chitinivorans]